MNMFVFYSFIVHVAYFCMDVIACMYITVYFTDDIFKRLFMNKKLCIFIRISLKFVSKGPIDNKSALVQVMAWRRTGDKPLPEPMMSQFTDAYMRY